MSISNDCRHRRCRRTSKTLHLQRASARAVELTTLTAWVPITELSAARVPNSLQKCRVGNLRRVYRSAQCMLPCYLTHNARSARDLFVVFGQRSFGVSKDRRRIYSGQPKCLRHSPRLGECEAFQYQTSPHHTLRCPPHLACIFTHRPCVGTNRLRTSTKIPILREIEILE
jgi:hypothetical protein